MHLINPESFELSIEQQFLMATYRRIVEDMTEEQAKEMILEIARQLMIKDNIIQQFCKDAILGGL